MDMNEKIEMTPLKIIGIIGLTIGIIWGFNLIEAWFGIIWYKKSIWGGFGSSELSWLIFKVLIYTLIDIAILSRCIRIVFRSKKYDEEFVKNLDEKQRSAYQDDIFKDIGNFLKNIFNKLNKK